MISWVWDVYDAFARRVAVRRGTGRQGRTRRLGAAADDPILRKIAQAGLAASAT